MESDEDGSREYFGQHRSSQSCSGESSAQIEPCSTPITRIKRGVKKRSKKMKKIIVQGGNNYLLEVVYLLLVKLNLTFFYLFLLVRDTLLEEKRSQIAFEAEVIS